MFNTGEFPEQLFHDYLVDTLRTAVRCSGEGTAVKPASLEGSAMRFRHLLAGEVAIAAGNDDHLAEDRSHVRNGLMLVATALRRPQSSGEVDVAAIADAAARNAFALARRLGEPQAAGLPPWQMSDPLTLGKERVALPNATADRLATSLAPYLLVALLRNVHGRYVPPGKLAQAEARIRLLIDEETAALGEVGPPALSVDRLAVLRVLSLLRGRYRWGPSELQAEAEKLLDEAVRGL